MHQSILFIHRSVGRNLIHDGKLYERINSTGTLTLNDYDQNSGIWGLYFRVATRVQRT